MTNEERYIARVLFVNKLLKANNQAFQSLFWAVKRAKHGQDFVEVRPQGRTGDQGCDGFLPADGHYFQLYGPVNPEEKIEYAATKLADDFKKIKAGWNQVVEMRAYSFAFNDKYEGTFTKIVKALAEIERTNKPVTCRSFTAGHLESDFLELGADHMQSVLGSLLPDPSKIVKLDYSILREVISYIMQAPQSDAPTRFGDLPDLNDKIQLNNLCSQWGDLIRYRARQAGHVEKYFEKNSTFAKQSLRDHLVERYRVARDDVRALTKLPSDIGRDDLVFDRFRQSLLPPDAPQAAADAIDIIIGFYFEACDVFDPHADKDSPNASA